MPTSLQPTRLFQSKSSATRNPRNGTITATTLTLRSVRLITGVGRFCGSSRFDPTRQTSTVLISWARISEAIFVTPQQKHAALAGQPWTALPPRVAEVLRPGIARVSDEIIDAIRHGVPAY